MNHRPIFGWRSLPKGRMAAHPPARVLGGCSGWSGPPLAALREELPLRVCGWQADNAVCRSENVDSRIVLSAQILLNETAYTPGIWCHQRELLRSGAVENAPGVID